MVVLSGSVALASDTIHNLVLVPVAFFGLLAGVATLVYAVVACGRLIGAASQSDTTGWPPPSAPRESSVASRQPPSFR